MPFSASCTPLAPSSSPQAHGPSLTTCNKNSSHCFLNALSKYPARGLSASRRNSSADLDIRIPHRPRRCAVGLNPAMPQPGDRRSVRAVHLNRQQIVAPHAHAPRGIEVRDHAAFKFKRGVRGIVRRAVVRLARSRPSAAGCASRPGTTRPSPRRTDCRAHTASGTACR